MLGQVPGTGPDRGPDESTQGSIGNTSHALPRNGLRARLCRCGVGLHDQCVRPRPVLAARCAARACASPLAAAARVPPASPQRLRAPPVRSGRGQRAGARGRGGCSWTGLGERRARLHCGSLARARGPRQAASRAPAAADASVAGAGILASVHGAERRARSAREERCGEQSCGVGGVSDAHTGTDGAQLTLARHPPAPPRAPAPSRTPQLPSPPRPPSCGARPPAPARFAWVVRVRRPVKVAARWDSACLPRVALHSQRARVRTTTPLMHMCYRICTREMHTRMVCAHVCLGLL